jgi:hypothetical protein
MREPLDSATHTAVLERDGWRCLNPLCRRRDRLTVDHVIKRSQRGPNDLANLATLCQDCHMLKEEGVLVLVPSGDGTFRFFDTRRVVQCETCHKQIQHGEKAIMPTGAGGYRLVDVGTPSKSRPT